MKKIYLIEIAEGDDKIAGKAIYEYASVDDAVAAFHGKLGNAMRSDLFKSELVTVIDSNGLLIRCEKWERKSENSEE